MKFISWLLPLFLLIGVGRAQNVDYRAQVKNKPLINDQDPKYKNNFAGICTDSASFGVGINLTATWDFNGTCTGSITAYYGGILKPTTGHTITLTGSFEGDLSQHFDLSGGGIFDFSNSKVKAYYPQWFGATCDNVDSLTALNNMIKYVGVNKRMVWTCPTSINDTLIIPFTSNTDRGGYIFEGSAFPAFASTKGDSLKALSGLAGKPMIKVFSENIYFKTFGINCNSVAASTGITFVTGLGTKADSIGVSNCSSGDGIQVNSLGGSPVAMLTSVLSGSSTAVTVSTTSLPGQNLHDATCTVLAFDYGLATQERVTFSIVGSVITPSAPYTYAHTVPYNAYCDGNNNQMVFNQPRIFGSGGWAFNVLKDPGNDTNNIVINDPFFGGNVKGGAIMSGFTNIIRGGHYEGNNGPPIQLGDILGGDANGTNGRATYRNTVDLMQDNEQTPSTFNTIYDVCGQQSHITYNLHTDLTLALAGKAILSATNANPVVFTIAANAPLSGSVVLSGGTGTWTAVNGSFIATRLSDTTFSIPVNSTSLGALAGSVIYRNACTLVAGLGGVIDMGQGRDQSPSGFPVYSWKGIGGRVTLDPNGQGLFFFDNTTPGTLLGSFLLSSGTFSFGGLPISIGSPLNVANSNSTSGIKLTAGTAGQDGLITSIGNGTRFKMCAANNCTETTGDIYSFIGYTSGGFSLGVNVDPGASKAALGGGSATKLTCFKSDGATIGWATMSAGNISACN